MRAKLTSNVGATEYWRFPWLQFPDGFMIGERENTGESLGRKYQAIMLTPKAKGQKYFPLEDEPGISRMFAGLSNASDVLGFANRFGELGLENVSRFNQRYSFQARSAADGEDIRDWLFEARKLRRLYRVWDALQAETHSELRQLIRWTRPKVVTAVFPETETAIADEHLNAHWFSSWPRGDVVGPAKLYLVEQFNNNMQEMASPMLLLDAKGVLRPYNSPASLLGALWLEFGQLASGVRKQLPCESCGKVMDVTGSRSDKRKHPNCVLREKMARYRNANKGMDNVKTKTRKR